MIPPPTPAARLYVARLQTAIARQLPAIPTENYARTTRLTTPAKRG
jgi:hypothetical protein